MGDTGALGLGGLIAGLAMATRTVLLLPILGGLFVIITMSVVIQIELVPDHRQTGVPDVAAAAPLRAGRLERGQHRGPVLDHRRHRRRDRRSACSTATSCG